MRILILGANGMIGHQIFSYLSDFYEAAATLRGHISDYSSYGLFDDSNSFSGIDVRVFDKVEKTLQAFSPDVVINAIGDIHQSRAESQPSNAIELNALFPHKLAKACEQLAIKLIHISSDCVYSGKTGNYSESDEPDATSVYGRTKALGEVSYSGALTIRVSTIGLELGKPHNLIGWFLSENGVIKGYTNAIYTGILTIELGRVLKMVLEQYPEMTGIWNVASSPISKYDLLCRLKDKADIGRVQIEPKEDFYCDRTLNADRFNKYTGYQVPDWDQMTDELATSILELKNK